MSAVFSYRAKQFLQGSPSQANNVQKLGVVQKLMALTFNYSYHLLMEA